MSSEYLSELSPKDKPWDLHRAESDLVTDLYRGTELSRYSERVEHCAWMLQFALKPVDDGELQLRLESAHFCRVRTCPVCQWRRSLMWKARFYQALPKILKVYSSSRWIFLTISPKTCPLEELRDNIAQMNGAWKRLSERKVFPALGYVKSMEVTRAKHDYAHPHFHVLMMVSAGYFKGKGYIKQDEWTELWRKSARLDYTPIVHVEAVKPKKGSTGMADGLTDALCETLKYTVKPYDLTGLSKSPDFKPSEHPMTDQEWLIELTHQLHKTRAVSIGGVLREFMSDSEPDDSDLIHGDESVEEFSENDPRFLAQWQKDEHRYKGDFR